MTILPARTPSSSYRASDDRAVGSESREGLATFPALVLFEERATPARSESRRRSRPTSARAEACIGNLPAATYANRLRAPRRPRRREPSGEGLLQRQRGGEGARHQRRHAPALGPHGQDQGRARPGEPARHPRDARSTGCAASRAARRSAPATASTASSPTSPSRACWRGSRWSSATRCASSPSSRARPSRSSSCGRGCRRPRRQVDVDDDPALTATPGSEEQSRARSRRPAPWCAQPSAAEAAVCSASAVEAGRSGALLGLPALRRGHGRAGVPRRCRSSRSSRTSRRAS